MLYRLLRCIVAMHPLSCVVLRGGVGVSALLLFVTRALTYHMLTSHTLNSLIPRCTAVYPMLALMTLSLSVVGALLIDLYAKTQMKK